MVMKGLAAVAVLAMGAVLSGCAAWERAAQREEARQLAWTGPGAGPCAWGGVTPRAEAHCAMVSFGGEGVLYAVNEKARARLGQAAACADHVELVERTLSRHLREFRTERIFSCPLESRARGECRVSLLVTTAEGDRYVLDNGAVVNGTVGVEGVARFADFARAVEDVYWLGFPPSAADLAAVNAGVKPEPIGIAAAR